MSTRVDSPQGSRGGLRRVIDVQPGEKAAVWAAFCYFGCLLAAYYVLRPLREAMGTAHGVRSLPWFFTGTFILTLVVVPAFSRMVSRFRRSDFVPRILHFLSVHVLAFWVLLFYGKSSWHFAITAAFFVWLSVFNIFVCSLFWSHAVDVFSKHQAARLFGFIAGGGTIGGILGSLIAKTAAAWIDPVHLFLVPAVLLQMAIFFSRRLDRAATAASDHGPRGDDAPVPGSVWSGLRLILESRYIAGMALFMLGATFLSTTVYHQQNEIVGREITDPARRTELYATVNLITQILIALIDIFLTARVIRRFGVSGALGTVAAINTLLFLWSGLSPTLLVIMAGDIVRRTVGFALGTPSREVLFTPLSREAKYRTKNFIDNVVFRGGDVLSSWTYRTLHDAGLSVVVFSFLCAPLAVLWGWLGIRLGSRNLSSRP